MPVDERARHRLYLKLEEVLGGEEAGTLMNHLPRAGLADLATRQDLDGLKLEVKSAIVSLRAEMERLARRLIMWTSSMVLASAALAFAAGRFV